MSTPEPIDQWIASTTTNVPFTTTYEKLVQEMLRAVGCPEVATIDQAAEALSKIHWSASPAQEKQFLLEELPHRVERITPAEVATLLLAAHHGET